MNHAWLLPEHIEDILPPYARLAEGLRRRLLDLFAGHGYDLVCPPMIEYLDSLLTGSARDLDLKTFKVIDGLSGRQMGVRADMTPQAARIDAHLLDRQGVTRLCYAGPVLHTRPAGLLSSREPYQLGAELFGYAGIEADREILGLLLAALRATAVADVRVSLGHVGLFRELAGEAGLSHADGQALFRALRAKDMPGVESQTADLPPALRDAFRALPELYGDAAVIELARAELPALPGVTHALDELAALLGMGQGAELGVDLADLRGYGYHTGMVFAVYVGGQAQAVALGGRYDGAGALFGRARPATGFSLDLRRVLASLPTPEPARGILAPASSDPALQSRIDELRDSGERVIVEFPGQAAHRAESGCDRHLVCEGGRWNVSPMQPE
jgi:ATP phosphoribosyltransferase regulatory subunit